jgi:nicotinamidase/pyrazinamidase
MEVTGLVRPALLVVDVQNDFCPGGSLAVANGDKVVPPLNRVSAAFAGAKMPVFFSRDWHPSDHCSFKDQGGIWPTHCVAGTPGAAFHHDLKIPRGSKVINKATESKQEAYSAFQGTDLAAKLHRNRVDTLYVGGLATDYCVKQSVLDALAEGLAVRIMQDCVRGVNLRRSDSASALRAMKAEGAGITTSAGAIRSIKRAAMKSSS